MPDDVDVEQDEPEADDATRAEEAAAAATRDPSEAPDLPPSLLHAAQRAGLAHEDIEALGDRATEVLQRIKGGFDQVSAQLSQLGQQALRSGPQQGEGSAAGPGEGAVVQPPVAPAGAGRPRAQGGGQSGEFNVFEEALEPPSLDEDVYGADVTEELTRLTNYVNSLRGVLTNAVSEYQAQQYEQVLGESDEFFDSLPEPFQQRFGQGSIFEMPKESEPHKARMKLLTEASAIRAGARSQGLPMTRREAFERALSIVAGDLQTEATRQEMRQEAEDYRKQALRRPSSREGGEAEDADAAAVAAAAEKLEEIEGG